MTIYEKLMAIQQTLKAPKDLENKFGGYKYRSAESILEAVKPLLAENKCVLLLNDSIEEVGGRVYVKATALLKDLSETQEPQKIMVSAFAREEESKKGMDASQVTGAASSYARKYALNGLFCIDDNKDSDFTNTQTKEQQKAPETPVKAANSFLPKCADCGVDIPDNVHDYSVKKFGRPLCRKCQIAEKDLPF